MKVLVTGANGFLAANVIRELLKSGHPVKGMYRSMCNLLGIEKLDFEHFKGNISRRGDVFEAAKDCSYIIHIAANTNPALNSLEKYVPANIDSTKYILEAAKRFGIRRIIFVSTANTCGHGTLEAPGTEQLQMRPPFAKSYYALSKANAEQLILQAVKEIKTEVVIVNPTFMIGPYDTKPSSGRIILMGYNKRISFIPPGGKNFVHVKDVAVAICNALEKGRNGERYLLCNQNMTYRQFFKLLNENNSRKTRYFTLPKPLLLFIGILGSIAAKLGLKTSVKLVNMQILCEKNYYSGEKSLQELGLPQTPIHTAVQDALQWFKEHGYIREKSGIEKEVN